MANAPVVVQSLSHVLLFVTPQTAAYQVLCPPLPLRVCSNSCPSSQWCYLIISSSATPFSIAFNLSQHHGFFQWMAFHIRWSEYWSFSFCNSPSNDFSGLISFRIDLFDICQSEGLSRVFSSTTIQKHQFLTLSLLYGPTLTSMHDYRKKP